VPQEVVVVVEGELGPIVDRVEVDVEDVEDGEDIMAGLMLMKKKKMANQARMANTVRAFLNDPGIGQFLNGDLQFIVRHMAYSSSKPRYFSS
jgi:hypothetical protein